MRHPLLFPAIACLLLSGASARAEVTFRGGFESGDGEGFSPPGAGQGVSVVSEPAAAGFHAARFALAAQGEPGLKADLRRALDARSTREGAERVYGLHVFVPQALPRGRHEIARFETAKGTPVMAFVADGESVDLVTYQPGVAAHYGGQARLAPGRWHPIIIRVVWSRDPRRGEVEVWYDGDKMVAGLQTRTLVEPGPVSLTVGLRREVAAAPTELFVDEVVEATRVADLRPPFAARADGDFTADVVFARPGGHPLLLDAWVPEGKGPFPAVVIVHGGGFVRGDKQSYVRPLFDVLSEAGFAWFTIDYRLAPRAKFPAAVDDVESALAWVKRNARHYRIDTKRIALFGESAGGYLVSLVGTRRKRGGDLAAVLPFYTYHEFKLPPAGADGAVPMPRRGSLIDFFGIKDTSARTAAFLRSAAPLHNVRADMPPFLLYHAKDDASVPFAQSVQMCEAIVKAGGRCDLFAAEGLGHGLGKWKDAPAEHQRLVKWLSEVLGP